MDTIKGVDVVKFLRELSKKEKRRSKFKKIGTITKVIRLCNEQTFAIIADSIEKDRKSKKEVSK